MAQVTCPYCNQPAALVAGVAIYPYRPDLAHLSFWQCAPCGARVGCHKGTTQPLGRLANAELRLAKQQAHAAFDPLWRTPAFGETRNSAYNWLADRLGIPRADCHIGMFDVEQCRRVVEVCAER